MLRVDRYFFQDYYIKSRGDYTEFKYVRLDLVRGYDEVITCDKAFEILNKPVNPPMPQGLTKHEYAKTVVKDLSSRGFDDYLRSHNLEDLRRYALNDELPTLVKYLTKAQETIARFH